MSRRRFYPIDKVYSTFPALPSSDVSNVSGLVIHQIPISCEVASKRHPSLIFPCSVLSSSSIRHLWCCLKLLLIRHFTSGRFSWPDFIFHWIMKCFCLSCHSIIDLWRCLKLSIRIYHFKPVSFNWPNFKFHLIKRYFCLICRSIRHLWHCLKLSLKVHPFKSESFSWPDFRFHLIMKCFYLSFHSIIDL